MSWVPGRQVPENPRVDDNGFLQVWFPQVWCSDAIGGKAGFYVEVDCPEHGEAVLLNGGQLRTDQHPPVLAGLAPPPRSVPGPAVGALHP